MPLSLYADHADDVAFATLKAEYADVLGGAPQGMQPDLGMEFQLKTGNA